MSVSATNGVLFLPCTSIPSTLVSFCSRYTLLRERVAIIFLHGAASVTKRRRRKCSKKGEGEGGERYRKVGERGGGEKRPLFFPLSLSLSLLSDEKKERFRQRGISQKREKKVDAVWGWVGGPEKYPGGGGSGKSKYRISIPGSIFPPSSLSDLFPIEKEVLTAPRYICADANSEFF